MEITHPSQHAQSQLGESHSDTSTAQGIATPVNVTVEKLVYGGEGLARLESGEVVFIPWSAPGDELNIQTIAGKPLRGSIQRILSASPNRVEARCQVFTRCGGCNWQHLNGDTQRDWKTRIVQESLQRIGKLPADTVVLPTIGSDASAWEYRNRAQWDVDAHGPNGPKLGYHAAGSSEIVEFDHCPIIPEGMNAIALAIRGLLRQKPALASGLKRIEAVRNQQGQALIILESVNRKATETLAHALSGTIENLTGVSYRNHFKPNAPLVSLLGQNHLAETLRDKNYRISAGSFFQTNLHGANQLLEILEKAINPEASTMLDLYAGVGVFALHFASRMSRVLAIESAPSAIEDARENLKLNQAKNIELQRGDARLALQSLKENFDVAIVDPPRAGCSPDVLNWLNQRLQQQLLYVSCNPTTLARDLKTLVASGWKVDFVQPVDMFPQTYHIECVAKLSRA